MNYKNLALLLVALVLSFAAAGVWIVYSNTKQQSTTDVAVDPGTTPPTTTTPTPPTSIPESTDVLLSFDKETMNVGINQTGEVTVMVDSSGAQIQTVSLVAKFDPSMIRVNSITGTGAFDLYLNNTVDSTAGYVRISGATTAGKTVSNDPMFAKINFTRLAAGESEMTVLAPEGANDPYSVVIDNTGTQYSVPEKVLTIN